jgi:hypothetical protein
VTPARRGPLLALLTAAVLLAGCGASAGDPQNDPATTAPASFDEATFDASAWR